MKKRDLREETNIPVISWVTRRLIAGPDDIYADKIARLLDVRINAKKSDGHYISLKGTPEKNRVVEKLIRELDQHAGLTAKNEAINTAKQIKTEHYKLMAPYFERLLAEIAAKPAELAATEAVADQAAALTEPKPSSNAVSTSSKPEGTTDQKPKKRKALTIKFNDAAFLPRNLSQAITYLACKDPANGYVYAAGPFGGGKTYTPLRAGFEAYNEERFDEIILIRPSASTGRDMGAMPGNARAKMDPYLKGGLAGNIEKMTTMKMPFLEQKGVVRAITPDFERGETYERAFVLVDEPQNLTVQQAELLVGRLGEGSIMVFAGDIGGNQNDLKGQIPGLTHLIATQGAAAQRNEVLRNATAFIQFKDSDSAARNPLLPHVADAINNPPSEYATLMATFNRTRRDAASVQAIEGARDFAVARLTDGAKRTLLRYESDIQSRFPSLYAANREAFSDRPALRIA